MTLTGRTRKAKAKRERTRELERIASNIALNATFAPDPQMEGSTDVYLVPLDDIDELRELLKTGSKPLEESRIKFFFDNAGYSYDPKTETPEQGRRKCAVALAKAEVHARREGWYCEWFDDPDGCIGGDCGETETCDHPCCQGTPHVVMCCQLYGAESELPLASLGSICEPSDEYRRVVEAELAQEAMPN